MKALLWPSIESRRATKINAALLLLAYLGRGTIEAVNYVPQGTCSSTIQRTILQTVVGCQARETLIDLKKFMPNISNVIQLIPDYANVNRCGGSCDMFSHSCNPVNTRTKRIQVMVVKSNLPQSQTVTQCGHVDVEEHVSCSCDCPVLPNHCRSNQYYEVSGCRCVCQSQAERNRCIAGGMQWDPANCVCMCPVSSWRVCSTGYIFDYLQTCQCIPTSTTASMGLLAASVVLFTCIVLTVITSILMYKRKVGIFRQRRRRSVETLSQRDISPYTALSKMNDQI